MIFYLKQNGAYEHTAVYTEHSGKPAVFLPALCRIVSKLFDFLFKRPQLPFLLFGFIAVLLGGVGSTFGALVGGLIMGVTDTFSGVYLNTAYKYLAVCVIFMLIVTFRPKGLFGK